MGAEQKKIHINQYVQYIGQVCQTQNETLIPEGKGKVTVNKNLFQGVFVKGNLIRGKLSIISDKENISQINYQGCFNEGAISGQGQLILNKKSNQKIIATGIFNKGSLAKGQIRKQNHYQFKGKFSQDMKMIQDGSYHNMGAKVKITGNFSNGNLLGAGKYYFPNGDILQGNFLNGKPHQQFIYKSNQFSIQSSTCNWNLDGVAKITLSNKTVYEGQLKDGKLDGHGQITYGTGTKLQGQFLSGSPSGNCKITYPADNEIQSYEGQMEDNYPNGIGIITFKNGIIYKGYFYYGKKNGPGYLVSGTTKYHCLYSMDKLVGQPKKIM